MVEYSTMRTYFKDTEFTVRNLVGWSRQEEVYVGNPSGWTTTPGEFASFMVVGDELWHNEEGLGRLSLVPWMDVPVRRMVCPGMPYEGLSVWMFATEVPLDWIVESVPDSEECEMPFG